jgi:hypothetical protein
MQVRSPGIEFLPLLFHTQIVTLGLDPRACHSIAFMGASVRKYKALGSSPRVTTDACWNLADDAAL